MAFLKSTPNVQTIHHESSGILFRTHQDGKTILYFGLSNPNYKNNNRCDARVEYVGGKSDILTIHSDGQVERRAWRKEEIQQGVETTNIDGVITCLESPAETAARECEEEFHVKIDPSLIDQCRYVTSKSAIGIVHLFVVNLDNTNLIEQGRAQLKADIGAENGAEISQVTFLDIVGVYADDVKTFLKDKSNVPIVGDGEYQPLPVRAFNKFLLKAAADAGLLD